ncbi:hypothetical protein N0V82_005207 [Gnomoniopsis sp. IMI 355080]|nr:hypothetical protein N0V82_005207 [Gnomoniopsis sp. IMI 355080]
MDVLKELWELGECEPKCCHCGKLIANNDVLARTFSVQHSNDGERERDTELQGLSKQIAVPSLSSRILLHDRHLQCLHETTKYVAVSHVWDRSIAELQAEYWKDPELNEHDVNKVACIAREVPVRVYMGLTKADSASNNTQHTHAASSKTLEVWHDYVSVPQWHKTFKGRILTNIPSIYKHADFVVVYMSDLQPSSVYAMREGSKIEDRIRGITDVCNTMWFRRMWTAMECVRASRLRPMLADFSMPYGPELTEDGNNHGWGEWVPFFHEAHLRWQKERNLEQARTGSVTGAQVQDRMTNIAMPGRNLLPHMLGNLGPVRALFVQGRLTEDVVDDMAAIPMDKPQQAATAIARACMRKGDLSPLLMLPKDRDQNYSNPHAGFNEFGLFGLNPEVSGPKECKMSGGNPVIRAERIGTVTLAKRLWKQSTKQTFHELARMVLGFTGPNDIDAFVETICCHFFGEKLEFAQEHLAHESTRKQLRQKLTELYNEFPDVQRKNITDSIASILSLDQPHPEGISANLWSPIDFSKCISTLRRPFYSLPSKMIAIANLAVPLQVHHHGRIMHGADERALASVRCEICHRDFLLQVALILRNNASPSAVLGAAAYRVPGLRYELTLPGGTGWLIKDGRIMARFLWAQKTCMCENIQEVEVPFPDDWIAKPVPNETPYGRANS